MARRTMNTSAVRILNLLGEKPKSKEILVAESGLSERLVRDLIRTLRENGYCVCSNSKTGGYWLGNEKDIEHTSNEMMHRGISLIRQARMMRPELPGQIEINIEELGGKNA